MGSTQYISFIFLLFATSCFSKKLIDFPNDTYFFLSYVSWREGQQQVHIVKNPCYEHFNESTPEITTLGNYLDFRHIFIDNGKYITIPFYSALNITYTKNSRQPCSIIIVPENQVIIPAKTEDIKPPVVNPFVNKITSSTTNSTIWINSTRINVPPQYRQTLTMYGFLATERVDTKGSVVWYDGMDLNFKGLFYGKLPQAQRTFMIQDHTVNVENVSTSYHGFVYCRQKVVEKFGVAYEIQVLHELVNECQESQQRNMELCKRQATCHDLIHGYYCAWPSNDPKYVSSSWSPYIPISTELEFPSNWIYPVEATQQPAINECSAAENKSVQLCKDGAICIDTRNSETHGYTCKWADEKSRSYEWPYKFGACDAFEQENWLCPSVLDRIQHFVVSHLIVPSNQSDQPHEMLLAKVNGIDNIMKEMNFSTMPSEEVMKTANVTATAFDSIFTSFSQHVSQTSSEDTWRFLHNTSSSFENLVMSLAEYAVQQRSADPNIQINFSTPYSSLDFEVDTFDPTFGCKKTFSLSNDSVEVSEEVTLTVLEALNTTDFIGITFVKMELMNIFQALAISNTTPTILSDIFAITLTYNIPVSVTFTMRHSPYNKTLGQARCAFWNKTANDSVGSWSTDGCIERNTSGDDYKDCQCDHLTHFGILLDLTGSTETISSTNQLILTIITYLGAAVCIVALSAFIFVTLYILKRQMQIFYVCLSVCTLLANLTFIVGISRTENVIVCAVIAGLIHYFFLAAFLWKLLFGCLVVTSVLRSIEIHLSCRVKFLLCLVGFGVPLIAVIITAVLRPSSYGTQNYCWLSTEFGARIAFVGPVAIIILANLINILIVIISLWRMFNINKKYGVKKTVKFQLLFLVQATLCMGLTWLPGLFIFDSTSAVVCSYLFSIFNGLQGCLIFVTVVIIPKSTREQFVCYVSDIFTSNNSFSQNGSLAFKTSLKKPIAFGNNYNVQRPNKSNSLDESGSDIPLKEQRDSRSTGITLLSFRSSDNHPLPMKSNLYVNVPLEEREEMDLQSSLYDHIDSAFTNDAELIDLSSPTDANHLYSDNDAAGICNTDKQETNTTREETPLPSIDILPSSTLTRMRFSRSNTFLKDEAENLHPQENTSWFDRVPRRHSMKCMTPLNI